MDEKQCRSLSAGIIKLADLVLHCYKYGIFFFKVLHIAGIVVSIGPKKIPVFRVTRPYLNLQVAA